MIGNDPSNYPTPSNTSEVSWSEELPLLTNTGRYDRADFRDYDTNFSSYSSPSSELFDSPLLRLSLVNPATRSPQDLRLPTPMSGRTTLQSPIQDSSLDVWPSNGTPRSIGMWSGMTPSVESSTRSPQMSESTHTTHYAASPRTTWLPHQWNARSMYSGERLEPGSQDVLGTKRAGKLIRRFHQPSSGTDTVDRKTWSSTNSLDKLELNTCCVGVTDTPCPSKRRVQPVCLAPRKSGSPQTWTREIGIQVPPNLKRKHYCDD